MSSGLVALCFAAWLGLSGWRFYNRALLPEARTVPTATSTPPPDLEALKREGQRIRQVQDYVGAGIAYRQANRRDLAIEQFTAALALDPANFEAHQNLREMGVDVPSTVPINTPIGPTPTVFPTVTPRP